MSFRRIAVVMAGGSGTRFWPVSTPSRPKQFLRLAHPTKSLLQESVERIEPLVGKEVFIATAPSMIEASRTECPELNTDNFWTEPHKRNTLGALVWVAANIIATTDDWENVSMAILTADHLIRPAKLFCETVDQALNVAEKNQTLVTIGIPPTRPATEYGYIEVGDSIEDGAAAVNKFLEKPVVEQAQKFLESGNYYWNSGMFFWTLKTFCEQLKKHSPIDGSAIEEIAKFLKENKTAEASKRFLEVTNISIDYALMEKADSVSVVKAKFEWDDLGSWDALSRNEEGEQKNVIVGEAKIIDSEDCVIYNDSEKTKVNVLGMKDVVVVVTENEVMVCPKSRAQEVKKFSD